MFFQGGSRLINKKNAFFEEEEYDKLLECVHCGMCLSSCPTYRVLGVETDSPRGRLHLMKSVADKKLEITDGFVKHMDQCLNCRTCEDVCPANVQFGTLMELTREKIVNEYSKPKIDKLFSNLTFKWLFSSQKRIEFSFDMLKIFQKICKIQLGEYVFRKILPKHIWNILQSLPTVPDKYFTPKKNKIINPIGPKKHKVGFLAGCIMSTLFSPIDEATVKVLSMSGCEVIVPQSQVCCGAVHLHNGIRSKAKELAKINVAEFEKLDLDFIIVNAAGCGASMKEYGEILKNDSDFKDRAVNFSNKVIDVTEFLIDKIDRDKLGRIDKKVTYQDPCHLARVQKIRDEPRELLRAIPGLEVIEHKDSDICCGGAGTYFITNYDLSMNILDEKMNNIKNVNPDIIVTTNAPCIMELRMGVQKNNLDYEVKHLIELLYESYMKGSKI